MSVDPAILTHWNERAALGAKAGTQDLILKELEHRAILKALREFREIHSVLEVGCGRGELAREAVRSLPVDWLAVDGSPAMIEAAKAQPHSPNRLRFIVRTVDDLPGGPFSAIVTERCLINLPTWEAQHQAIQAFAFRLVPGGRYVMCEHSQEGLRAINLERQALGLSTITPPWHNRYLRNEELATVTCLRLRECVEFSSTYYLLSRLVNAKLAQLNGTEPDYNATMNHFAKQLESHGPFSQARLWIWEKPR